MPPREVNSAAAVSANGASSEAVSGGTTCINGVRLKVVPVKVWTDNCKPVSTYAFLDEGSDMTLCAKSLANELKVKGVKENMTISTVSGKLKSQFTVVSFNACGINETRAIRLDRVCTVDNLPDLSSSIPCEQDVNRLRYLNGIKFVEIPDRKVELLIDADVSEAPWA